MKIYILPVHSDFQPAKQPFLYPKYNVDYGVEQDFLTYLHAHPGLVTTNANQADWHYLPIYWTRYHLNRHRQPTGLLELQAEVYRIVQNDRMTFTVCQFDDGPKVDLGNTVQCLSSRKNSSVIGIDIPLLASPIHESFVHDQIKKKYLAVFLGQFKNHPIRSELYELLKDREDIYIRDGDFGIEPFVNSILESAIGICPRGYGGSSFRLFEVMQLGRVPLLIGDIDPRPFKSFFPWQNFSFFIEHAADIIAILGSSKLTDLERMGLFARDVWGELSYQKWCPYLIRELELIKHKKTNLARFPCIS